MKKLFESLEQRLRPEDVAEMILKDLKPSDRSELNLLKEVSKYSISNSIYMLSSMMQSFRTPVVPTKQVKKAQELFKTAYQIDDTNADEVLKLVKHISNEICKPFAKNDFKSDRLNRESRKQNNL